MSTEPKTTEKSDKPAEAKDSVAGTEVAKQHAEDQTGVNPGSGTEVTPSDAMKKQEGFDHLKK